MGLIDNIKSYQKKISLSSARLKILEDFLEKGFPTIRDEEWKYTSLKNAISHDFQIEEDSKEVTLKDIDRFSLGFKNRIILVNGKIISSPKIKGVSISEFSSKKLTYHDPMTALNAALAKNGVHVSIDKNVSIIDPIEILFITSCENDNFQQYRNEILIEKGADVKFVERMQNLNNSTCFVNSYTSLCLKENSCVEYNKIQNNTRKSIVLDNFSVFQQSNSSSQVNTLIFGGGFTRNNLNFQQNGINCNSNMNGIVMIGENEFADNHTFVDHKHPNCQSNEMYKGVYMENAKGVFNGKIMVRPDAQKINAFQSNNNLLLSDFSSVDTKPQLEIYADDVKCSHGCTVGQIDQEALFYMRSRGIRKKEAEAILTYLFANESLKNISVPKIQAEAKRNIALKLNINSDLLS